MSVSKYQNLKPVLGGLREFEIILHDFNLSHTEFHKAIIAKSVIYSVNGNREIFNINILDNGKVDKNLESMDSLYLRDGICKIFHSEPSKEITKKEDQNLNFGSITVEEALELTLNFDFSKLKRKLKKLFLEKPFVVLLKITLKTPIQCFSDSHERIFVIGNEFVEDPTSDEGVGLPLRKSSSLTFDYGLLEGEGQFGIDPYQRAPNIWGGANSHGTSVANFEWVNSKLVKEKTTSYAPDLDHHDMDF